MKFFEAFPALQHALKEISVHQSASVLLVPVTTLSDMPLAFQKYVERYFLPKEISGDLYLFAFETLSLKEFDRPSVRAVAPSHRVDLDSYKESLSGVHLSDWIETAIVDGRIFRLSAGWDDGTLGFAAD